MKSVYCAVRTASLNKTDYVPSFKGKDAGTLHKIDILPSVCGPGSSFGIATGYGLDGPGSNPGGGEIFRTRQDRL
jgi:hypothetical protein